ncbi:MAG: hypothetical protein ACTSWQ_09850 [Candidatus Thorarchaeota archaeon]
MSKTFIATVWPFAENRIDEIRSMIKGCYSLVRTRRFEFDLPWPDMVEIVYASDRIKRTKLMPKVDVLSKCPKYIILLYIEVDDPEYYMKPDGRKISGSMAALKRGIRAKFGPKREADKNPLHIPDRESHSKLFEGALKKLENDQT